MGDSIRERKMNESMQRNSLGFYGPDFAVYEKKRHRKMIWELERQGIPKERALCSHIDDPLLLVDGMHDFFILLCIEGELSSRIDDFWSSSQSLLGWDYTTDSPPHLTVLHFEACCTVVQKVHNVLRELSKCIKKWIENRKFCLKFETTDEPFIGFVLNGPDKNRDIHDLVKKLSSKLSDVDPKIRILNTHTPSFTTTTTTNKHHNSKNTAAQSTRLTLAHRFPSELLPRLLQLCEACFTPISHNLALEWSVRLYSRDPRLRVGSPEIYEMQTTVEQLKPISPLAAAKLSQSCPGDSHIHPLDAESNNPMTVLDRNGDGTTLNGFLDDGSPQRYTDAGGQAQSAMSHHMGDLVLLMGSCSLPGRQGCPVGVNLATGCTGVFNLRAGRRVPQFRTWVLHGSIPIDSSGFSSLLKTRANQQRAQQHSTPVLIQTDDGTSTRRRQPSQQSTASYPIADQPVKSAVRHLSTSSTSSQNTSVSCPVSPSAIITPPSSPITNPVQRCVVLSSLSDTDESCWIPSGASAPSSFDTLCHPQVTTFASSLSGWHSPSDFCSVNGYQGENMIDSPVAAETVMQAPVDPVEKPHLTTAGSLRAYFGRARVRKSPRRLFVMRHTERVDICFGRGWVTRCFDKKGVYRRLNLNLPQWLPPRDDYLDYALDAPITQIGLLVAAETGRSLAEAGVHFNACFTSPSLRCVQTACELLRAMGRTDLLIRIEPHFFEWYGWYSNCCPRMMSPHDLRSCGYPIDTAYQPLTSLTDLTASESVADYYERSGRLIKRLLASHKAPGTSLLIVAHASSLDTCTHHLVHHLGLRSCISVDKFRQRTSNVPYGALVMAEERRRWSLIDPPVPAVCSYTHNQDFDWKQLMGSTLCGFDIIR